MCLTQGPGPLLPLLFVVVLLLLPPASAQGKQSKQPSVSPQLKLQRRIQCTPAALLPCCDAAAGGSSPRSSALLLAHSHHHCYDSCCHHLRKERVWILLHHGAAGSCNEGQARRSQVSIWANTQCFDFGNIMFSGTVCVFMQGGTADRRRHAWVACIGQGKGMRND